MIKILEIEKINENKDLNDKIKELKNEVNKNK